MSQTPGKWSFHGAPPRAEKGGAGSDIPLAALPQGYPIAAKPASKTDTPGLNGFIFFGTAVIFCIIYLPLVDACRLLQDPTFRFFCGTTWPALVIVASLLTLLGFSVAIVLLFRWVREEYRTEQTALIAAVCLAMAYGLVLLCISRPIAHESNAVYDDLFFNCQHGPLTTDLYKWEKFLQATRALESCANESSIEYCTEYQDAQPYTDYMKAMEVNYQCAGFCVGAPVQPEPLATSKRLKLLKMPLDVANSAGRGSAKSVMRLDAVQPRKQVAINFHKELPGAATRSRGTGRERPHVAQQPPGMEEARALSLDPVDTSKRKVSMLQASVVGHEVQPAGETHAARALFSLSTYEASCDGMAGRALKYAGDDVGSLLRVEGVVLLGASVLVTLVQLIGMYSDGSGVESLNSMKRIRV